MRQYSDDEQIVERIIDKSDILWSISQKYPEEYGLIQPGGEKDKMIDAVRRCDNPVLIAVLSDALSFLDRMQQGGLDWHGFSGVRRTPSFEGVIFNMVTLMEIACGNPYSGGGVVVNTGPIPDHLDHDDADAFRIIMMSTVLGMDMQIHALRHDARNDDDVIVLTDTCFDLVRLISESCDQPDRRLVAETIRKMVAKGLYPRADKSSVESFYKRYGWGPAFIRDITINDFVSEVLDMESLYGRMGCVTRGDTGSIPVVGQIDTSNHHDEPRYDDSRYVAVPDDSQADDHYEGSLYRAAELEKSWFAPHHPELDHPDSELYEFVQPTVNQYDAGRLEIKQYATGQFAPTLYGSLQYEPATSDTAFQAFGQYGKELHMPEEVRRDDSFGMMSSSATPLSTRIPQLIPDPFRHDPVRVDIPASPSRPVPVVGARHRAQGRSTTMKSMYGVRGRSHVTPGAGAFFSLADS